MIRKRKIERLKPKLEDENTTYWCSYCYYKCLFATKNFKKEDLKYPGLEACNMTTMI